MAQQKITLIAELKDKLSGPLNSIEKAVDSTTKAVEDHAKRADKAYDKAADAAQKSADETKKAGTRTERALAAVGASADGMAGDVTSATNKADRALAALSGDAQGSADKIDRALAAAGERGGAAMVSNLKTAGNRMATEGRTIGKETGKNIASSLEAALSDINLGDMAGLAAGAAGGVGTVGGFNGALDADHAARVAAAQQGFDPAQVNAMATDLYKNNWGASIGENAASVGTVAAVLGLEIEDPRLRGLMEGHLTLRDVFPELSDDVLALNVNILAEWGGYSAEEAQDVFAGQLQGLPERVRDELMDNFEEYSKQISSVGITPEVYFPMIQGATAAGVQSVDKTNDLMFEWGNQLNDPEKNSEFYAEIGLDQADIAARAAAGDPTAFLDTARALGNVEDKVRQQQIAAEIWGTQAEDLGLGNIDELADTWGALNTEIDLSSGKLGEMNETVNNGVGADWSSSMRELEVSFKEVGDAVAPFVTGLAKVISVLSPLAGPAGLLMMAAGPAGFLLRIITGKSALDVARGALGWFGSKDGAAAARNAGKLGGRIGGINGALGGLSRIMMAHPLLTIGAVIYAGAEAFKWLYENVDFVRTSVDALADSWDRAKNNLSDYMDMADNGISGALGLENKGGHREYRQMMEEDRRPGWLKDFTRPLEEGLGLGPQQKPHEGLFSLPKPEGHADGGWTTGNGYYAGERGREFITSSWASNKVETNHPGALATINATGELPTAPREGDTIMVDARGAAPGVEAAVYAAVEAALARQGRKATREYMTPTVRGAG